VKVDKFNARVIVGEITITGYDACPSHELPHADDIAPRFSSIDPSGRRSRALRRRARDIGRTSLRRRRSRWSRWSIWVRWPSGEQHRDGRSSWIRREQRPRTRGNGRRRGIRRKRRERRCEWSRRERRHRWERWRRGSRRKQWKWGKRRRAARRRARGRRCGRRNRGPRRWKRLRRERRHRRRDGERRAPPRRRNLRRARSQGHHDHRVPE
jgi:hypothetical protein